MPGWLAGFFRLARRLYEWVEGWAGHPYAVWILALVAFVEAIFFPIPPDVLLIPMAVARPRRALLYAGVCLGASLAGGIAGYAIGATAMDTLGTPVIRFYGLEEKVAQLVAWYQSYDAWIVVLAGFTPLPYKLFTLTSGAAAVDLVVFVVASLVGRGARFFLVGGLIAFFGERAAAWIDRHFNALTVALAILIVLVVLVTTFT